MRVNLKEAAQAEDFREYVNQKLRRVLPGIDVLFSNVLLATYIRPEKTSGGIIRPDMHVQQDVWQGKVGLILKMGPTAYKYAEEHSAYEYEGIRPEIGDYVMCHSSDPRELGIQGVSCKLVSSYLCRMRVQDPEAFY